MKQNIFDQFSSTWWDKNGPMRALHSMHETRMLFIKERIMHRYQEINGFEKILKRKKILDLGCGGGILAENLSRFEAEIMAIDNSKKLIQEAKRRAKIKKLKIDYQQSNIEKLLRKKMKFDIIICLEVIEHVTNFKDFLKKTFACLNKKGIVIFSTINRSPFSYFSTILVAEKILKLVPNNTHNWNMYIKPEEIINVAKDNNFRLDSLKGLFPLPTLKGLKWIRIKNTKANYIISLNN